MTANLHKLEDSSMIANPHKLEKEIRVKSPKIQTNKNGLMKTIDNHLEKP